MPIFPREWMLKQKKLVSLPPIYVINPNIFLTAVITPFEYNQLRAFARLDGVRLSAVWIASFACYVGSLSSPVLGAMAMLLALSTPVLMSRWAIGYARTATGGTLSFRRAYFYCLLIFFYAALLLAFAQWVYFAFIDHGTLLNSLQQMLATPEGQQAAEAYGLTNQLNEALAAIGAMRPIDIALNILSSNLMLGLLVSLLSAVFVRFATRSKSPV